MNTQADKAQENKSQSVANAVSKKQGGSESTYQFVDNRPEGIGQRELQEVAINSPQAKQLEAIQQVATKSPLDNEVNMTGDKPIHETLIQKRSIMQFVLNMGNFVLAKEIASDLNMTPGAVFNIMLAHKLDWVLEDDQKDELKRLVLTELGVKQQESEEYEQETLFADEVLQAFFESSLNKEVLGFIQLVQRTSAEYAVLYRGANPVQALKIMSEQTLGGAKEIMDDLRDPPTEQMQILQTGEKIKDHTDSMGVTSTLEEWSRGTTAKESFSKNGWVLKCIVAKVRTNYASSMEASDLGEAGVVGWIETPCLVAIEKKGSELI